MTDDSAPAPDNEPTPIDADEAEIDIDLQEPLDAVRLSPYALAAFIVSLFSLSQASQVTFFGFDELGWRSIAAILLPAAAAGIGLWLTGRAEEEIFVADGRFGGVGFYRAARLIAIAALVFVSLPLVFELLSAADLRFDV